MTEAGNRDSFNEAANKLFYAQAAGTYEETGSINSEGNRSRVRRLLTRLVAGRDLDVLDVCCGAGLYLGILKDLVKPERLHGLDLSPEMLQRSARFCRNLTEGSVYRMPFRDGQFDLVTCSSALHHLDDLSQALREIHRVLRPGGVFLSDYDNNTVFASHSKWRNRLGKVLRVKPVLDKVFGGKKSAPAKEKKALESMSFEELHQIAEVQNDHHDGVDAGRLKRLLREAGFEKARVYTFSSAEWNDGKPLGVLSSLSNNKIYSVSVKGRG